MKTTPTVPSPPLGPLRHPVALLLPLVCCLLGPPAAAVETGPPSLRQEGQLGDSSSQPPARTAEQVATEQSEVKSRLEDLRASIDRQRRENTDARLPDHVLDELELLKWLDLLYSQGEEAAKRKEELEAELAALSKELESLRSYGVAAPAEYTFLALDDLRDKLNAEKSRRGSLQLELDAAQALLASAKESYRASEASRRMAREALEGADEQSRNTATRRYALARLRGRARGESLRQQQLEYEITKIESAISEARFEYLREKVALLRKSVRLTPEELDSRMAVIDKAEVELRDELGRVQGQATDMNRRLAEAKRRRDEGGGNDDVLRESTATWQLGHKLLLEEASLLKQLLAEVGLLRVCWRRRFALSNGEATPADILRWQDEVRVARQQISRFKQLIEIRMDERRGDLATLQKRLLVLSEQDTPLRAWVSRQAELSQQALDSFGSQLVLIKSGQRLLDRFEEELTVAGVSAAGPRWLNSALGFLWSSWNYEITSVDDRPITVRKIVIGLGLLLAAFLLARLLSGVVGRHVLPRFGLNSGATLAFQSIAFYLMLTCFGVLSLEIINLPITIFAFMGGAIAIGIGFGSQNVLNNFISGLILLAERPIRVGDLVDIDGLNGTIERIGARSTRVKTGANLEIIVPNAKFLENNVTNWTLSDTRIRMMVAVGVAYGSPTREVHRLLLESVQRHPDILKSPPPIILFKEFGDNSLNFEVHFWVQMRTIMQGEAISSEVRHTIDDLFAQANITIAFPQRDVHLDVSAPIDVNLRSLVDQAAGAARRRAA